MNLFEQINSTKDETKKHLLTIDGLIDNGLQFVEENLVYKITNSIHEEAILFLRTGILSTKTNGKKQNQKLDWESMINFLKTV
ncbi:MAG: hypothetical protein PHG08_00910 [Bacilli bacterium]|nr:hypothetical protein [Bacilli bacterium]